MSDPSPVATVLIPTTGDRRQLLEISVGSVLAQTVAPLELFIVGDGVAPDTRAHLEALAERDPRVRFFDHPKHRSRGEPYRHAALAHARGLIVSYLTDRDYMLPDHLDTLDRLLQDADFAHTQPVAIAHDDTLHALARLDLRQRRQRRRAERNCRLPLSTVGHTLEVYRRLPFGWRTTPEGQFTDRYMWQQLLSQTDCRAASCDRSTILYFPRGRHPGWPDDRRLGELERWVERMQAPHWREEHDRAVAETLHRADARRAARPRGARRVIRRSLRWLSRRGS